MRILPSFLPFSAYAHSGTLKAPQVLPVAFGLPPSLARSLARQGKKVPLLLLAVLSSPRCPAQSEEGVSGERRGRKDRARASASVRSCWRPKTDQAGCGYSSRSRQRSAVSGRKSKQNVRYVRRPSALDLLNHVRRRKHGVHCKLHPAIQALWCRRHRRKVASNALDVRDRACFEAALSLSLRRVHHEASE